MLNHFAIFAMAFLCVSAVSAQNESPTAKGPSGNAAHLSRLVEQTDQPWKQQLYQNDIDLKQGENYVLTFWAKASKPLKVKVSTKNGAPPWAFFGLRNDVDLTTEWTRVELGFPADEKVISGHSRLSFNFGGPEAAEIWIADVRLQKAGADPKTTDNLIQNPRFQEELTHWYAEGAQAGVYVCDVQSLSEAGGTPKQK